MRNEMVDFPKFGHNCIPRKFTIDINKQIYLECVKCI